MESEAHTSAPGEEVHDLEGRFWDSWYDTVLNDVDLTTHSKPPDDQDENPSITGIVTTLGSLNQCGEWQSQRWMAALLNHTVPSSHPVCRRPTLRGAGVVQGRQG
ncbi:MULTISPECIES: hypothetical protein, partial [unclassified Streptomyces]|uniref:hypothetical protein n=1 Tax=unclassified Streptomyces TaxID=2593676 RepID=UPI001C40621A